MNRNLSDCAAMACLPVAAVATVALPRGTSMDYAKELYLGMKEAADVFRCEIVGGDTAAWDGKLVATVSIIGRSDGIQPVRRSGSRPGDLICVTGELGGSLLGRHMIFTPHVFEARAMASTGLITSMIDISDGLSRDLRQICNESRVGAVIRAAEIPVHEDAIEMRRDGRTPLEHALHDGEDHELLFTASSLEWIKAWQQLQPLQDFKVTEIGTITAEPGIFLEHGGQRTPLEPKGWEHTF